MSDDLTFGVKLEGDGSSLISETKSARDEMVALKKATDDLSASSAKAAAQTSTDWASVQQSANASAAAWMKGNAAADAAADKAWALANGYKEVGGQLLKAGADSSSSAGAIEKLGLNTQYARREMVQLGKEAISGDFSRMPNTLAALATHSNILPAMMSPVGLAIAGITAAAAIGAVAWYKWGKDAEEALKRVQGASKDAEQDAAAALAGVIKTDREKLRDIQWKIDGASGQLAAAVKRRDEVTRKTSHEEVMAVGAEVIARRAEIAAYERQVDQLQASIAAKEKTLADRAAKKDAKDRAPEERMLAQAASFDQRIIDLHKDTFTKDYELWVEYENKLVAAGAKGAEARAAHEAALTVMLAAESAKRIGDDDKAAEKKAAHLASQLASEDYYFAQVAVATGQADSSASAREEQRFQGEVNGWKKRYDAAKADHDLTLEEEQCFQDALAAIKGEHDRRTLQSETTVANMLTLFKRGENKKALDMAQSLTAGLATHSRAAFEINKIATQANLIVTGIGATGKAYDAGLTETGSPWGGAAYAVVTAAWYAAQFAAVSSSSFGGGGVSAPSGGGVPSQATSPGAPVSIQPPAPGTAAPTAQQFNLTIIGAKENPDKPIWSYNSIVDEFLPLWREANANGHKVELNVMAG